MDHEREKMLEVLSETEAVSNLNAMLNLRERGSSDSDELSTIEELFGCSLEVSKAYRILDAATENCYVRFVAQDNTEVSISEDGDLFKVSTIHAETTTADNEATSASVAEAQEYCLEFMPKLHGLFHIEEKYDLVEAYDFDEDYTLFVFERMLKNGITNPYQSINVVFNKEARKLSIAVKFDGEPNALEAQISAEEAITIANSETLGTIAFDNAELTYIGDEMYGGQFEEYDDTICYLVYKVTSDEDNLIIYIDALSGEYICRDMTMAETGWAVTIQETSDPSAYNYNPALSGYSTIEIVQFNTWRARKMSWAYAAMGRLGYNATSHAYTSAAMITDVRNYLQARTDEYAFYFSGHGSETVLGFKQNGWIRRSDVVGNWHFVFLDACSTAVNTGWADAFKINGYANRAFLGWNGSIEWSNGYKFASHFWPLVDGSNTIQQAAVDAAALVPGAGTTPIRFYGDTSYTGEAWS